MNVDKLPVDLKNYFSLCTELPLQNKFLNIKSASEKVDFCLQLLRENKNLEQLITQPCEQKDDRKTEQAYVKAKVLIEKKDYSTALQTLNEGLSFAPKESKFFGKLYGLRAQIYLSLGLYQHCLENVGLAGKYHAEAEALDKIREKCGVALLSGAKMPSNAMEYNADEVQLSYPSHPNIPFVAECINLSVDKIYGRNLMTDRDLRPGDIIMMERPFAAVIEPIGNHAKCSNCLSFNFYNLIPCPESSTAMFCTKVCYQEAYKKFHRSEAKISQKLKDWFNGETCVALRLLVLALNTFPDINDFKALTKDVNGFAENQFSFDFKNPDQNTIFKTLCSLTTVESDRTLEDLFKKSQIAAVLYTLLSTVDDLPIKDNEAFVKEMLFQFIQATTINTFSLYSYPEMVSHNRRNDPIETTDFAISSYPLSSFLSHSCSPNVRKARAGANHEIMVIFVVRPIRAGERICDCYDQQNNHINRNLEERRSVLYNQYFFMCQCEACTHDYPQERNCVAKLKPSEWSAISSGFRVNGINNNEEDLSHESTVKNIEAISTFLNDYDQLYPCIEILTAQKTLHENMRKLCSKAAFVYH